MASEIWNRDSAKDILAAITATRDIPKDVTDIYYTKSVMPSVGDVIYDSNKQDSGKTISVVGDGYIEFSEPWVLSLKSSAGVTETVNINNTKYTITSSTTTDINITTGQNIYAYWVHTSTQTRNPVNCTIGTKETGNWLIDDTTYHCRATVFITDMTNPVASFTFFGSPV